MFWASRRPSQKTRFPNLTFSVNRPEGVSGATASTKEKSWESEAYLGGKALVILILSGRMFGIFNEKES